MTQGKLENVARRPKHPRKGWNYKKTEETWLVAKEMRLHRWGARLGWRFTDEDMTTLWFTGPTQGQNWSGWISWQQTRLQLLLLLQGTTEGTYQWQNSDFRSCRASFGDWMTTGMPGSKAVFHYLQTPLLRFVKYGSPKSCLTSIWSLKVLFSL